MRRLAALILAASLAIPVSTAQGAPAGYAGGKHLGPAPIILALRPTPIYGALDELRTAVGAKIRALINGSFAGASRVLGFDPGTRGWLADGGIDPAAPLLLALWSVDLVKARAANRRLEVQARKYWTRRAAGDNATFDLRQLDLGAPVLVAHRLVMKIADAAKTQVFIEKLAQSNSQGVVLLRGKSQAEVVAPLAALLGLATADAESLATGLLGRNVLIIARQERDLVTTLRIVEQHAVADFLAGWVPWAEKPGKPLVQAILAALPLPARAGLDLEKAEKDKKGVLARAFTADAAVAVHVAARPWLAAVEAGEELRALRFATWVKDVAAFNAELKRARACPATWSRAVPVGDLALQLTGNQQGLHVKAFWAVSPALAKSLAAASTTDDLIDPTAWQGKAAALCGTTLNLGVLAGALAKGPFKLDVKGFEDRVRGCTEVAKTVTLLGAWPHLVATLRAEAKTKDFLKGLVDHVQQGVIILREVYSLANPTMLLHFALGPKASLPLKEQLGKLSDQTHYKPQDMTVSGRTVTIHRALKAPLTGNGLAVTDLKKAGATVTMSNRSWDLSYLVNQLAPPATPVLPRTILAFGYADLSVLVQAVGRDSRLGAPAPLIRAATARLDKLGASLKLVDGVLSADLDIGLK